MTKEECKIATVKLYGFYIREVLMMEDFELDKDDLRQADLTTLTKFVNKLDKQFGIQSVGITWLVNYFDRQFQYWVYVDSGGRMRYGLRALQLSWIIGDKAYKRHDVDLRHFYSNNLTSEFRKKLKFSVLKEFFPKEKSPFTELSITEESEKERFYNTDAGLLWCIQETDMYHHKSKLCTLCINAEGCKRVLKHNFPKIYTIRGYE